MSKSKSSASKQELDGVDSSLWVVEHLQEWSADQIKERIKDCFVTGQWAKGRDAEELLNLDDEEEVYGDFEDLETGEVVEGAPDDGGEDEEESESCDVIFADSPDEVILALSTAAKRVHMGADACHLMKNLRTFMRDEHNSIISDRRLVKGTQLLKICAASHGRDQVDPIDCILLQHCMWQLPEQREVIKGTDKCI